jgi:hypothetical protein
MVIRKKGLSTVGDLLFRDVFGEVRSYGEE